MARKVIRKLISKLLQRSLFLKTVLVPYVFLPAKIVSNVTNKTINMFKPYKVRTTTVEKYNDGWSKISD